MAMLYGDLNKPGPYLVMMKWNPGWYSAPHNYRTDRICVVVSGTWWVESGADFTPQQTVPVAAGGYVLRHARTWHYDGVPADGKEPVMIAVFGSDRSISAWPIPQSRPGGRFRCTVKLSAFAMAAGMFALRLDVLKSPEITDSGLQIHNFSAGKASLESVN